MSDRKSILPGNEAAWLALRVQDVTSTESAALFGLSPYATEFELWHRKHDAVEVEFEENERMRWGTRLQDAIAVGIAHDYGVMAVRINEYMRIEDARMGASFDYEIVGGVPMVPSHIITATEIRIREMFTHHGPGLFEIKNVDRSIFREQWKVNEDKSLEAPGHIEIQLQHQLHVRDREWGAIGVLVGGNTPRVILRMRDREVGFSLETRIRKFWESIAANEQPTPQFPGDSEFVSKLYQYAEPGKVFDGRGNAELAALALNYRDAAEREKQAKAEKESGNAEMLTIIGDAERAILDNFTISAGVVGPAEIAYHRDAYRSWRLVPKKGKS